MRKLLLFVTITLFTFSAFSQQYYQVTADVLNVRSSANKNSNVIAKLSLGESIQAIDYGEEWSKVRLANKSVGYVSSKFLSKDFKTYSYTKGADKKNDGNAIAGIIGLVCVLGVSWWIYNFLSKMFGNQSNQSIPQKNPKQKPLHWYVCKNCNEKVQSSQQPKSLNCSHATFHYWTDLGEVGNRNYNCKNCGITVWTTKQPTSLNCSRDTFHYWTAL